MKRVEMLIAHLKRIRGLRLVRLRGLNGAISEFLLVATAQRLFELFKIFHAPQKMQKVRHENA
jgi:hypothetical protein